MSGTSFRGASLGQDPRFGTKQHKAKLAAIGKAAPPEFDVKVDMKKVKKEVIEGWLTDRINTLLGFEDDVVMGLALNSLDDPDVDPRAIVINLQGFLEDEALPLVAEMWKLLVSAQDNPSGVPTALLESKRAELLSAHAENQNRAKELTSRIQARVMSEAGGGLVKPAHPGGAAGSTADKPVDPTERPRRRHRDSRSPRRRRRDSRSPRRRRRDSRSPRRRRHGSRSPRRRRRGSRSPRRRRRGSRSPRRRGSPPRRNRDRDADRDRDGSPPEWGGSVPKLRSEKPKAEKPADKPAEDKPRSASPEDDADKGDNERRRDEERRKALLLGE